MTVRILQGDVRAMLATLTPESVQTCVTSPPYWGLRSYGTEPQIWGGDAEHAHEWGSWIESHDEREAITNGKTRTTDRFYGDPSRRFDGNHQKHIVGAFCSCGAWLGELGNEPTPEFYVEHMVEVFRAVWRVLRKDGTLWLNLGFSYAGSGKGPSNSLSSTAHSPQPHSMGINSAVVPTGYKAKDLIPIPFLVAMALQQDGWYWRSTIVWAKKAPMPESVTDRPTSAWEPVLLMSKSRTYFYDADAVREPLVVEQHMPGNRTIAPEKHDRGHLDVRIWGSESGRNMRNVWLLGPEPFPDAHFATFPTEIPRRCILAGSRPGDTVLDPFAGAGTTLLVADRLNRHGAGIELKPEYAEMARARIVGDNPLFTELTA